VRSACKNRGFLLVEVLEKGDLELIKRLVDRLERLSADSTYSHQASGLRGSLYRYVECMETGTEIDKYEFNHLVELGFTILKNAAREVGASR
jgi:hypothetical protein